MDNELISIAIFITVYYKKTSYIEKQLSYRKFQSKTLCKGFMNISLFSFKSKGGQISILMQHMYNSNFLFIFY